MDTIFATSSGSPPAAIAIVRLSGPCAREAAVALAGPLPRPRVASLRSLHDPRDGQLLDRALVLVFDGPATATGEDVVELHVHGGRAVVAAVEGTLAALPSLRRAEPGEFTRRALTNGVIDLTEAEGLGDLLSAETEGQRRAALRIAEGGLRARIEDWTTRLVAAAATVEAQLDFSDEDDVAEAASEVLIAPVIAILREIDSVLDTPPVERLKDGIHVVLAGPPNSGKSTLLNALAGRDVAIVSPIAGTTRDRIEVPVVRDGVAYVLTDTAGLAANSDDPIERIGIDRAREALARADIVLWLGDDEPKFAAVHVYPRADLVERSIAPPGTVAVSAIHATGIAGLWDRLSERANVLLPATDALAINARQREGLEICRNHLAEIANAVPDLLIVAERLRLALRALHGVTGKAEIENVLDALFANFCIGK